MNAERKRLIQGSWDSIARDHDRIAVAFYDRLFEIDVPARAMFAQVDMSEQRTKFLVMLGEIVKHLDLPESLIPALRALGQRHRDYGVRPIDYDRVREALFAALAGELGDGFTVEVREAWEEAYALISSVMQRAGQN
jgi:hemoglobin-like flavoprotein